METRDLLYLCMLGQSDNHYGIGKKKSTLLRFRKVMPKTRKNRLWHDWNGAVFKNVCIDRESNPGRPRGRRAFYHWTIDACFFSIGNLCKAYKCYILHHTILVHFCPLCSSNGRNEVFLAIIIISTVGASITLKLSIWQDKGIKYCIGEAHSNHDLNLTRHLNPGNPVYKGFNKI